jgi:hypothetical protein
MPGDVIGRSELPRAVDDTLARETSNTGDKIGRLRLQTAGGRDVYSAELLGKQTEIVTLDARGRVLSHELVVQSPGRAPSP